MSLTPAIQRDGNGNIPNFVGATYNVGYALPQLGSQYTDPVTGQIIAPEVMQAVDGFRATYSAAVNAHAPAATPTDWFTIQGSATKTIRILRVTIGARATAANQYRMSLIKYSAYLTGGTAAAVAMIPHDSANPAATALVNTWAGGLPTPGTALGKIADDSLPVGVLGTPTFNNEVVLYDFGQRSDQAIVLRGIAQYLAINSGGAALPAGFVADVRIVWTEDSYS